MKMHKPVLLIIAILLINTACLAQASKGKTISYDLYSLAQQNKLTQNGRPITPYADSKYKGIHVAEGKNKSVIWMDGPEFSNGIIELDIKGRDELQRNFIGIAFHGLNDSTFEDIYFRPFNFRNPDSVRKIHAVQYESNPQYPWSRLREQKNGQYEKGIMPPPLPTEWFHAKIVVNYPLVQVYVNGNNKPSLTVTQLSNRRSGKFGLMADNENTQGEYANLKVTFR